MTLALYGKSRKRRGALLLTAFLAVLAATLGGLALIGTAFAHIANYSATAQCNGDWQALANYTQGSNSGSTDDRRLIIFHNINVDGQPYASTWSSGAGNFSSQWGTDALGPKGTNGVVLASTYTGTGTSLTSSGVVSTDYIWIGSQDSWTFFSRSQTNNPLDLTPASWSGTITLLKWGGSTLAGGAWFNPHTGYDATITAPSAPSGCAKIVVKKVTVSDPGATSFTANIQNTDHTAGTVTGASFSVAAPYTDTFQANGTDDFTVTEGTPPTNWANTGWSFANADGTCPAATPSNNWKSGNASGGALKNIASGKTVVVCFKNTYTAPSGFITISDNACTTNVAGSGTWHFVAPNTTKGSGGLLTVTYHFNGESVGAHTTTQAEDTGSHSNAQWYVNIPFGTHTSITIDSVTDANGDAWNGVNGASFATMQSSSCPSATGTLTVYKLITNLPNGVTVGSNFTGTLGSYSWTAAANGSAWTQAGATLGSYTVAETGGPTTASDGGTISLVGYAPPTVGTLACPTESAAYGTDAAHTTQTLAAQGTSVFCVLNVYRAPETVTQQVTFIKYICPNKAAVPVTYPSSNPVKPDMGGCTLATTAWTFNLYDYGNNSSSLGSVQTATDGSGSVTVALTSPQISAALGAGILVKEATPLPTGFTFYALRCYNDNFQNAGDPAGGLDNQELIQLAHSGTTGVYCLAYNIANSTTTFDKTDSLGTTPTVNAGTPFTWTIKATVSGSATTADQTFSDTIPNGFAFVSLSTGGDTSLSCTQTPGATTYTVNCTLHSGAAVGAHTVTVNVLPGAGACGPFTNTVNGAAGAVLASDREITVNCSQQVTFIKYICPTASDIPADPAFGTAVTDNPGNCTRATSGWTFTLGSTSHASDLGTVTTGATGSTTITLNAAQLTQALKPYPGAIRVSEVLQSGYTLGSLRCYQDHAAPATDNDDVLSIASAGTPGVLCIAYNIPPPFTISTAKVVCDTESALPDHTEGFPITASTASAWVAASGGHCQIDRSWQFQWGYTSGSSTVSDAGPTLTGAAGGNWSTPFSGSTQVTDLKGNTALWLREVLPDGTWLPFSQDLTGYGNENNDPIGSAELACNIDGLHYDNFDRIDNVAYGKTLYCVAFNVKKTSTVDISKTDDTQGSVAVGGAFNWKLTVTIAGYQTTKASTISDPLPPGFTTPDGTINSSPVGISCTAASNVVTCNLPSGTAIGVYTITIPTTAPANGAQVCTEYTNTATLEDQAQLAAFEVQLLPTNPETYLHTTASDTVSVTGCSGTLHVVKITEGVADPHSAQFSGTIDNSQAWGPIGANGVSGPFTVSAGDHSIQEGPASQDPTLWTPVGLAYANVDHVCPANPDNSLTMPHVDAGASVYVCVYNLRKEAQSTDGTIKLIKVVTGNNPDNSQPFQVQAGTNSGTLTNLGSVTYHFAFSTDNPTVAVSPVGESSVPTNYQLLGYKVFSGGILSCPAVTDNSVATTVSTVGTLTIAQQTPAYTVCVYNQPNGTISVHKTTETNGIIDGNTGGWKFTASSSDCSYSTTLTTNGSGYASASVPACSDYVVTENTATPPFANYTVVGSATQTGIVVPAGGTGQANFLNVKTVNTGCTNPEGCTPPPPSCTVTNTCNPPLTITTPTPTPTTAVPTATPTTSVPTATPTKTVEKPANTPTATPSNTTNVLGEKTPGPGSTPAAPSTGSGFFGGTGGGFNAFIAALGLLALTAGFAILGVARKERRG